MASHRIREALVTADDDPSCMLDEAGKAEVEQADEGRRPALRMGRHPGRLVENRIQLQDGRLLLLPPHRLHHTLRKLPHTCSSHGSSRLAIIGCVALMSEQVPFPKTHFWKNNMKSHFTSRTIMIIHELKLLRKYLK